jgi:molecular chaperone HtpG
LTEEEIQTYLATIGRGYTRELREKLSLTSPEEAAALIGQFGLGFLSAFLLASEVSVVTRSIKGTPALRWQSSGDEHYDLTPAERSSVGTTVRLKLKPAASFILKESALTDTIRQYADFLPTPIYVQGADEPVNLMCPPWDAPDPTTATQDFVHRAFGKSEPLWIMPLTDWKVDLGHDTVSVPLKGFLFIPPGSVASVREFGDVTVYIRRMFICERERDLLPPWARFVRGVIECPSLQPTASREGIHQDENYESVRQALEEQLGQGLRTLAKDDPQTWKKVVKGHSDVIVGWAVSDNEFFERVEDIVTFRTSRGPLSLSEYLDLTGGSLYYVTRELGSLQEQVLAEGRDVPAIDASWFAVTPFLQKYANRHHNIKLVQLDGEAEQLLRPVRAEEKPRFEPLLEYYRDNGVRARIANFKPADLPALLLYPQGAELAHEARESAEAGDLPPAIGGLVNEYIDERFKSGNDLKGTLYLNASCPLVRRLPDVASPDARGAVLTLLHQVARLFAGRMLSATDAISAFRETTTAIEGLLQP